MIKPAYLRKLSNLSILILAVLVMLLFSFTYFLYHRFRSQAAVYIFVNLRPLAQTGGNQNPSTPYWLDQAVKIGDKELSSFGKADAEVIDKESYEGPSYYKNVYLELKIDAVRDRSGVYLFKNKPLSVGGTVDFRMPREQFQGFILSIGDRLPNYKFAEITFESTFKGLIPVTADNLQAGEYLTDQKGKILARVLDKKISPAEVRADTSAGEAKVSYDNTKRDMVITATVLVKEIEGNYYFEETQIVRQNESINIPWKSGVLGHWITKILKIREISG